MTNKRTRGAPVAGTHVIFRSGLTERWGVSWRTLCRWERNGKIPARDFKVGSQRGWRPETIAEYERKNTAQAAG